MVEENSALEIVLSRLSTSLLIVVLCLVGGAADASPQDAEAHYKQGMEHMKAEAFLKAGDAFWAAYQADPSPPLLWNAARAYHKADELVRARDLYQRFLEVEKQTEARWKKALELSKEVTQELETRAAARAQSEGQVDREALEREITDKVTKKILSTIETRASGDPSLSISDAGKEADTWVTGGWITAGVGTALSVGSLTLLVLANNAEDRAQNPPVNGQGIVTVHTQADAAAFQEEADDLYTGALVTGLVGAGTIALGLVLALTSDGDNSLAVAPSLGGASIAWGGRF